MTESRLSQLQIFGERCSGTNYVAQLLRRNLPDLELTDRFGWKHGFLWRVNGDLTDCLFVVVHRDPFDWVRSLHRQPWHAAESLRNRSFADFVRAEWWCEWGRDMQLAEDDARRGTEMMHERDPATGERFANALQMRAAKLRAWAGLPELTPHCISVRYEDVQQDEKRFVRDVAAACGLRRRLMHRRVSTFKGGVEPFVKKAHEPLAADDVDWIRSQLDEAAERAVGYDLAARVRQLSTA